MRFYYNYEAITTYSIGELTTVAKKYHAKNHSHIRCKHRNNYLYQETRQTTHQCNNPIKIA